MTEYITDHGEIIDDTSLPGKTPYQVACSQLAAFKLKTIETVAADPRLKEGACTEAIIVYLSFVTIDRDTLKPKPAYASAIKLMARGKMKSKTTAKKARQLLVDTGYLVPTGTSTKDGCIWYNIANPNSERVKMHVVEAEEYFSDLDAQRRREDRRKRKAKFCVVPNNDPTQTERGNNCWPHVGTENDPNYLRAYLRDSFSEGRDHSQGEELIFNDYSSAHDGDEANQPLPIPRDQPEADAMMDEICRGRDVPEYLRKRLMSMLQTGVLTPSMADRILGQRKEDAA